MDSLPNLVPELDLGNSHSRRRQPSPARCPFDLHLCGMSYCKCTHANQSGIQINKCKIKTFLTKINPREICNAGKWLSHLPHRRLSGLLPLTTASVLSLDSTCREGITLFKRTFGHSLGSWGHFVVKKCNVFLGKAKRADFPPHPSPC